MQIIDAIGQSLLTAAGMAWQVLWSLVLGFTISGMIQAYVSRARMSEALGRAGFKEIALATAFGAASSSCSYAAVAAAKSMFKRGADLVAGFIIAGFLAVLVPNSFWNSLFLQAGPAPLRIIENAIIGPIIAVISFVCSIGNVPLAAILFAGGITFGGAIAFLYGDLIVLPILDIYRKYYGWRLAAYITGILFSTMVLTAIIIDLVFSGLDRLFPSIHFIPAANPHFIQQVTTFSFDYTTVLNIIALLGAAILVYLNRKHPMMMSHEGHGEHNQ